MKQYRRKLRKHNDAILCLYSPNGLQGGKLISGSADHTFRGLFPTSLLVWDLEKRKIKRKHELLRPTADELAKIQLSQDLSYDDPRSDALGVVTNPGAFSPETAQKLLGVSFYSKNA